MRMNLIATSIVLLLIVSCTSGQLVTMATVTLTPAVTSLPSLTPTSTASPTVAFVPTVTSTATPEPTRILLDFELLGTPTSYNSKPRAWSITDLQLWHDRIYIGHGDWDISNAGPIRALYFDLNTEKVVHDDGFLFSDESIDKFQVFNDTLYVPGIDATESWDFGNIYFKAWGAKWTKQRTIRCAIHVWDVTILGKTLFAGGVCGAGEGSGEIWTSADNGQTWTESLKLNARTTMGTHTSFFILKDRLYAIVAAEGCFVLVGDTWKQANCMPSLFVDVYKNVIFKDTAVIIPYWSDRTWSTGRWLYFYDGKDSWSVEFPISVKDAVATKDGLYVLIGTVPSSGTILYAPRLDCRCSKDFTKITDLYLSEGKKEHPRGDDPASLEFANGRFYVGISDGRLFRSKPFQP